MNKRMNKIKYTVNLDVLNVKDDCLPFLIMSIHSIILLSYENLQYKFVAMELPNRHILETLTHKSYLASHVIRTE